MSAQQSGNVWQTAARRPNSQAASRTPQNRSGTASPSLPAAASQSPRLDGSSTPQSLSNVWAQRSSSAVGSNGPGRTDAALQNDPPSANGFNAAEVKAFLSRNVDSVTAYKPAEAAGSAKTGGAWGSKPNTMANGQPFLSQLAKQIATLEDGG